MFIIRRFLNVFHIGHIQYQTSTAEISCQNSCLLLILMFRIFIQKLPTIYSIIYYERGGCLSRYIVYHTFIRIKSIFSLLVTYLLKIRRFLHLCYHGNIKDLSSNKENICQNICWLILIMFRILIKQLQLIYNTSLFAIGLMFILRKYFMHNKQKKKIKKIIW